MDHQHRNRAPLGSRLPAGTTIVKRAGGYTLRIAADRTRLFVTTACYDPGVLALTRDDLSEILGRLAPEREPSSGGSCA